MQIVDEKLDVAALKAIGWDVVQLLRAGQIKALAGRFGYALAFGRELEAAIREDLAECLGQIGADDFASHAKCDYEVKFFELNSSNLIALVECVIPANNGNEVLAEVVITSDGRKRYATLEQISAIN
ncbi:MAG: hypothetical protein ACJ8GW_05300 [Massilia sp.]